MERHVFIKHKNFETKECKFAWEKLKWEPFKLNYIIIQCCDMYENAI